MDERHKSISDKITKAADEIVPTLPRWDSDEAYKDMFKAGAVWFSGLPLSDRLRPDEKDRLYRFMVFSYHLSPSPSEVISIMKFLFGEEMEEDFEKTLQRLNNYLYSL